MKVIGIRAISAAALMLFFVCACNAQQRKTPQLTTDDVAGRSTASAAADEPLMLLPPSDLILVVDVGRAFDALMPKLKTMGMDEIAQVTKALDEFTSKTGIDPRTIKSAVIGVKIPDGDAKAGSGAVILQGLALDPQKLAAVAKTEGGEFKTLTHQGKTFYVASKAKSKADKPTLAGTNEIAFALLDQYGVVAGDVGSVKSVLDAQTGASKNWSNALLGEALRDIKSSGWIRFAGNLPASFSQEMQKMGDTLQPFATVKVLSGSIAFDASDGSAAAIDLRMRTSSADEASRLETHLKGLVVMGKTFLSDNKDPQTQAVNQMLDRIQIGAQATNVSLSISLPKELIESFSTAKNKATEIK